LVTTSVAYVCDRLVLKYNNTGSTGTRADKCREMIKRILRS